MYKHSFQKQWTGRRSRTGGVRGIFQMSVCIHRADVDIRRASKASDMAQLCNSKERCATSHLHEMRQSAAAEMPDRLLCQRLLCCRARCKARRDQTANRYRKRRQKRNEGLRDIVFGDQALQRPCCTEARGPPIWSFHFMLAMQAMRIDGSSQAYA